MKLILLFITLIVGTSTVFGSEVSPVVTGVTALLGPYLGQLVEKWPWVGSVLSVMLWCRIVIKPLMAAVIKMGEEMPEGKIRKFMLGMSDHVAYKYVAFGLDWFASIKLPAKKA